MTEKATTGGNPNLTDPDRKCPRPIKDEEGTVVGKCGGLFAWEDIPVHGRRCMLCGFFKEIDKSTLEQPKELEKTKK